MKNQSTSIDNVSRRDMLKVSALFTASGALPLLRAYEARAQEVDAPVRIGYLPITDATPLLVAHGKGYFEAEGLKAEKPALLILTGLRLAIGIVWIVLVPCEMLGASAGLGYFILDTRDRLAYPELMAMVLIVGLLGFLLDAGAPGLIRMTGRDH